MHLPELINVIADERPAVVYLSGKTCTGKTTLAKRMQAEHSYHLVELDRVVQEAVIDKFAVDDRRACFVEVYRERNRLDWITSFVDASRERTEAAMVQGARVVLEAAIAHPLTLSEFLAPLPDPVCVFLHPSDVDRYMNNLLARFETTRPDYRAGLPGRFWDYIEPVDFAEYCDTRVISTRLRAAIEHYATESQRESSERLASFIEHGIDLRVVEV